MDQKKYQEHRNNEDKTLVNFNPELNQSLAYDNEGKRLEKPNIEQFDYIPRGFINSGLIFKLTANDINLYLFISSKCNQWRNTRMTNNYINRETGIPDITIKRALRRLEFYHFISKRKYFTNMNKTRRVITLLRWKTAYKRLIEEEKIKAVSDKEIVFITPYLPKDF